MHSRCWFRVTNALRHAKLTGPLSASTDLSSRDNLQLLKHLQVVVVYSIRLVTGIHLVIQCHQVVRKVVVYRRLVFIFGGALNAVKLWGGEGRLKYALLAVRELRHRQYTKTKRVPRQWRASIVSRRSWVRIGSIYASIPLSGRKRYGPQCGA